MILGFLSFFRGYRLMFANPRLRFFSILPFALSFLFFILALFLGFDQIIQLSASYGLSAQGFWSGALVWILTALALVVFGGFVFLASILVANIFLAPFNSILAEKTLEHLGFRPPTSDSWVRALQHAVRMLGVSLLKSVVLMILGLLIFFMGWIPLLGIVAWVLGSMILAFDASDYALEAMRLGFRERFGFFRKHLSNYAGFGLALGLTFFIPGANLFLLPGAVVGASILVTRLTEVKR